MYGEYGKKNATKRSQKKRDQEYWGWLSVSIVMFIGIIVMVVAEKLHPM
jgi:hypothetical protein